MESTKEDSLPQTQEEKPVEKTEAVAAEGKKEKGGNSKADRDKKKAERLAARQTKTATEAEYKKDPNDPSAQFFGDLDLNRSQSDPEQRYARAYTAIKDLDASLKDQEVLLRGRLHNTRAQGKKMVFITLRE